MTSKNVKVLGIICIVLLVSLIAVTAYFEVLVVGSLNSEIADRDSQIAELTFMNSSAHERVNELQDEVNDLNEIIHLHKSRVIYDTSSIITVPPFSGLDLPAFFIDSDHNWVDGGMDLGNHFDFAGYIVVQISSTSDSTYINYTCASTRGTFNLLRDIGVSGTTSFPVLPLGPPLSPYPAGGIFMTVSTHTAVSAKMNITATYYY